MSTRQLVVLLAVIVALLRVAECFHLGAGGGRSSVSWRRASLRMSDSLAEMREKLSQGDYIAAYQQLKRNPMLTISTEDAKEFLNHLDQLVPASEATQDMAAYQNKMIESSSFVYKRCERQNVFRGFGSAEAEAFPLTSLNEVSPARLQELTGLQVEALTPRQRNTVWQFAGIIVCAAEYALGSSLGIDPLVTLIPATLAALAIDQLAYKGAFSENVYQTLFPEYKQKVIYHEAGHFLLAYLLGIPVRGIVLNAMEARKYRDIRGSAGTIFFDTKLAEEMDKQRVTRESIDRLSIVIMAGIAAEALKFDRAEGGISDEQSLTGFLTSVQPPWSFSRIQGQARWAVSQAVLLIREHQASYDALVLALEEGKGVGDAVLAIEANLPAALPTAQRVLEKTNKRKKRDADAVLRFVQRRTYLAGGIFSGAGSEEGGKSGATEASAVGEERLSAEAGARAQAQLELDDSRQKIDEFAERMKLLETAVKRQDLDVEKLTGGGGIWLNALKSLDSPPKGAAENVEKDSQATVLPDETKDGVVHLGTNTRIVMPTPLPGYQEAVAKLAREEGRIVDDSSAEANPTTTDLLSNNRGYQMKELEIGEAESRRKATAILAKMNSLQQRDSISADK